MPHQSDNPQAENEQHTEVHVETHSESSAQAGSVSSTGADDQVAELTADLQRLQAEFQNYKRRAEAERAELLDYAKAGVVRQFLAVRDTFDAEAAHRPAATDPKWAASIDAIRSQFDAVLKQLGVERFASLGQPFDPHRHEAVSSDGAGETVIEELSPGYALGSTILRHAMVKVGAPADPAPDTAPPAQE
ncbi:MAG TPA: nucleotide exchange factor GrpE [Candidatus Saccharimonadia bacterium]